MTKNLRPILTLTALILLCYEHSFAQKKIIKPKKIESTTPSNSLKKYSVQLMLGSQGLGLNFRYAPTKTVGIRLGGSIATATYNQGFAFGNFDSDNSMKGTFSNFHILGELYPHKRIHLIGGLAYLNKAEAVMKITPTGSYKFGELDIPAEDIGDLNITTKWKGISPYLGVSFGRGVPKKRFGINFDIGTYYLSSPKVNFEGTKMLAANDSNSQIMENNMKDYRFMPVLQLNFNFKL